MHCANCERLRGEHERLKRLQESAVDQLNAAVGKSDTAQFMRLKTMADEASLDVDLVETEILQHQEKHDADIGGKAWAARGGSV
jgi:hypothetical protein